MANGPATSLLIAAILWPGFVYAGMGAATIPIIIHLMNKRRYRRVQWAATDFLIEAQRRNRRRVRVEELILLALRCLAMFLIGLMIARWFMRPESLLAVLGSAGTNERVIVLDDSFSMKYQTQADGESGTRFRRATIAAERLIRWLRDESPSDTLTLMVTSQPDTPLRSETRIADIPSSELTDLLATLKPSNRGGNMDATLAAVRSMLDQRDGTLNATVYVLSDFQQSDWSPQSEQAPGRSETSAGPSIALAGWTDENRSLRMVLIDAGSTRTANIAITSLDSEQSQVVTGLGARFTARIKNFSETETKAATLQVYVGDATQPAVVVPPIGPYETVDVPIEVTFSSEGSEQLGVELAADSLPIDNTRNIVVPVKRALKLLIVNGEGAADPYQDEVFLMRTALRPEGRAFSGNEPTVIDENELEQADLDVYDAIILANVYRINEDIVARLERYANNGGGVMIFLGDQVDPELYNRLMYRSGDGMLPARLTEFMAAPMENGSATIDRINEQHPALRGFVNVGIPYFADTRITQYIGTSIPVDDSATTTAPNEIAANANVLMTLNDDAASPLLIERRFGDGRVLLCTTSADKEWNNLADQPVYVVLLLELVQYSARADATTTEQLVAEPIRLVLDPNRYQPLTTLKPPSFPEDPAIRIDAQPDAESGLPVIEWGTTDEPGVYRFELNEVSGGRTVQRVSISVDPRESDLRRVGKAILLESSNGIATEYVTADDLVQDDNAEARQSLWPAVLLLLVLVLMLEQGLAWWFGGGREMNLLTRKRA